MISFNCWPFHDPDKRFNSLNCLEMKDGDCLGWSSVCGWLRLGLRVLATNLQLDKTFPLHNMGLVLYQSWMIGLPGLYDNFLVWYFLVDPMLWGDVYTHYSSVVLGYQYTHQFPVIMRVWRTWYGSRCMSVVCTYNQWTTSPWQQADDIKAVSSHWRQLSILRKYSHVPKVNVCHCLICQ